MQQLKVDLGQRVKQAMHGQKLLGQVGQGARVQELLVEPVGHERLAQMYQVVFKGTRDRACVIVVVCGCRRGGVQTCAVCSNHGRVECLIRIRRAHCRVIVQGCVRARVFDERHGFYVLIGVAAPVRKRVHIARAGTIRLAQTARVVYANVVVCRHAVNISVGVCGVC